MIWRAGGRFGSCRGRWKQDGGGDYVRRVKLMWCRVRVVRTVGSSTEEEEEEEEELGSRRNKGGNWWWG
jgi:hypothetical protein